MPTSADRIAVNLRTRIISGDLAPGSRLDVGDIGRRYRTSHIPIREALRQLETEGLLIHSANKSVYVAPLSPEEADGLYDVRMLLEPEIARRAVVARGKADIALARRVAKTLHEVDPDTDPVRFQQLHHRFHAALLLPGMTPTLRRVLEPIWTASERYLVFVYKRPGALAIGSMEHDKLLQLWIGGEPSPFAELIPKHLESARANLVERLTPVGDLPSEISESLSSSPDGATSVPAGRAR
jgi:DNA-binding GntR family transcriptional regulator